MKSQFPTGDFKHDLNFTHRYGPWKGWDEGLLIIIS